MTITKQETDVTTGANVRESQRLQTLQSFGILDTPAEQVFDEFAKLAASIIGTPTALVSLVDGTRQWFKARVGLDVTETPRDIAFCAHAIQWPEVFVVPDATRDERFAANPLVTSGPQIRFYAGAPLITSDGQALGTLCVIDYIPREFSAQQREALRELSQQVMSQLELRRRVWEFTRNNPSRQHTIDSIRGAIDAAQFELYYQPTVDVCTGHISGIEALIRWNCPDRGLLTPASFMPTLESSGMIVEVGEWVIRQAAADYRSWLSRGILAPRIAVNVSALQLLHPRFVSHLDAEMEGDGSTRVPLDIEISEYVLINETTAVMEVLREVQKLGATVAIDDFGTAHSALRHLAHLPIDTIKIDRAFTGKVADSPDDMALVLNMISMAHSLNTSVVAEGVETEEQRKLLRLMRCDEMQGYLFSMPLPAGKMLELLREDQKSASAEWCELLEQPLGHTTATLRS
jgi:EAL domain-containing protein (putative c-di-GMP-specific phosphodiesterase class I)